MVLLPRLLRRGNDHNEPYLYGGQTCALATLTLSRSRQAQLAIGGQVELYGRRRCVIGK